MESGRTTNNMQPKAPKTRMSCDSCQASKIRCGQERPACRRCVKYNLDCVYSPSRRAGRPRPRKTTPSTQRQTQTQTQTQNTSQPSQTALPTPITSNASPHRDDSGDDTTRLHVPAFRPSIASGAAGGPLRPDSTIPPSATLSPFPDETSQQRLRQHQQKQQDAFHSILNFGAGSAQAATDDTFSAMTFADFPPPGSLHDPALTFDFMLSPVQSCGGPQTPSASAADDPHHHAGRCSSASSASSSSSVSSCQSTESGNRPMRDASSFTTGGECHCAATLLQQLAESTAARGGVSRGSSGGDTDDCGGAFLVTAVQKSKVLLDHCFRVLCCGTCGPRLSSALMLCQAMDEVSMALGTGTLWAEQQAAVAVAATGGGGRNGDDVNRLSLSSSLTRDKVPLRCGDYVVRAADRRHVLRALIMKRLNEMQSAMGKLQQVLAPPAVNGSACQSTCASMVSELKDKILAKTDLFKVLL